VINGIEGLLIEVTESHVCYRSANISVKGTRLSNSCNGQPTEKHIWTTSNTAISLPVIIPRGMALRVIPVLDNHYLNIACAAYYSPLQWSKAFHLPRVGYFVLYVTVNFTATAEITQDNDQRFRCGKEITERFSSIARFVSVSWVGCMWDYIPTQLFRQLNKWWVVHLPRSQQSLNYYNAISICRSLLS